VSAANVLGEGGLSVCTDPPPNRSLRSLATAGCASECVSAMRRVPTEASERSERSWRRWAFPATSLPVSHLSCCVLAKREPRFRASSRPVYVWHGVRSGPGVLYPPKRFVYIIVSVNHPGRRYIGVTADVTRAWRPTTPDRIGQRFRGGRGGSTSVSSFASNGPRVASRST